jgi:hypothetical protein
MGKHGRNPRLWTTVLGLLSVGLVLAAVIVLVVIDPQWGTLRPPPPCQYAAMKVTVVVESQHNCSKIMGFVADDADFAWTSTGQVRGEEFARLAHSQDSVRIYESGNKPLAGKLADYFQKAQWKPEVPRPSPSP